MLLLPACVSDCCLSHRVVITSELWGTKNHGANYMLFDGCTSAFCTLTLAKVVAQKVYSEHIKDNPPPSHTDSWAALGDGSGSEAAGGKIAEHTCLGSDCFREAHLIEIALATTGCLSLLVLSCRVGALYRNRWAHEDADRQRKHMLQ